MTRLIGKLSKLSKYSASWSIVCTRLQKQAHVVIFLTLGELNKQQSQPTSEEAGGIALLRPRKRPKEGEALQEHRISPAELQGTSPTMTMVTVTTMAMAMSDGDDGDDRW